MYICTNTHFFYFFEEWRKSHENSENVVLCHNSRCCQFLGRKLVHSSRSEQCRNYSTTGDCSTLRGLGLLYERFEHGLQYSWVAVGVVHRFFVHQSTGWAPWRVRGADVRISVRAICTYGNFHHQARQSRYADCGKWEKSKTINRKSTRGVIS